MSDQNEILPVYVAEVLIPYEFAAKTNLREPNSWHRFTWMFFSKDLKDRNFLYRTEKTSRGYKLYIVSKIPSSIERLKEVKEISFRIKEVPIQFFERKSYSFTIKANPTKRENTSGKRLALKTEQEIHDWMDRKAEGCGFRITSKNIDYREFIKAERKDSTHCIYGEVEITGTLIVTDSKQFINTFIEGIGSAKGFGYGLLKILPQ